MHSVGVAPGSQPLLHGHNIPCRQARQAAAAAAASLGRTRQGLRLRRQVCEGLTGRQEGSERQADGGEGATEVQSPSVLEHPAGATVTR